jgi:hypothetical protein
MMLTHWSSFLLLSSFLPLSSSNIRSRLQKVRRTSFDFFLFFNPVAGQEFLPALFGYMGLHPKSFRLIKVYIN